MEQAGDILKDKLITGYKGLLYGQDKNMLM